MNKTNALALSIILAIAIAGLVFYLNNSNYSPPIAPDEPSQPTESVVGKPAGRVFETSFESLEDFSEFFITPVPHFQTSWQELSREQVHSGAYSHKAWIDGENQVLLGENTNHRGYPTIQLHKTQQGVFFGKIKAELWVWRDIELKGEDWFSFATFTSYSDDLWPRTILANIDEDGFVYLMHLPNQGEKIHDIFQTDSIKFPERKWVKLEFEIDFSSKNEYNSPYARVFQDGELVSAGRFNPRITLESILNSDEYKNNKIPCLQTWGKTLQQAEKLCGLTYTGGLAQAHFGMYSAPTISQGVVYNDNLKIYEAS